MSGGVLCAVLIGLASTASAQGGATAVLRIKNEGADAKVVETVSSILRSEVQQQPGYQVIERAAVGLEDVGVLLGCNVTELSCMGKVARQLKVNTLIYGTLRREQSGFRLRVEVFDASLQKITYQLQKPAPLDADLALVYRAEIERFFSDMRQDQHAVLLKLGSNVRGASVKIDGEVIGQTPFETKKLKAGRHTVVVEAEGFESWSAVVELVQGNELRLWAPLKRRVAPVADPKNIIAKTDPKTSDGKITAPADPQPVEGRTNWGAWGLIGVGGAALVGSAVSAGLMLGIERDLKNKFDSGTLTASERADLIRQGERYELSHQMLLGVGGVSVAAGLIWLIVDDGGSGDERVRVGVTPGGVQTRITW